MGWLGPAQDPDQDFNDAVPAEDVLADASDT